MSGCNSCGGLLKPEEEEGGVCFGCRMSRLQEKVQAPAAPAASQPVRPSMVSEVIFASIGAACLLGTALQLPGLLREFRPLQPVRYGYAATDAGGDKCIAALWLAAAELQSGGSAAEFYCPASREQYIVEVSSEAAVVSCPNPERHGLRELSASSVDPVPLAVN